MNNPVIDIEGVEKWYNEKNEFHRLDGPAIELPNIYSNWYQNGKLHRVDGPAVEWFGSYKAWYQNGKKHRIDGPAVEWSTGNKEWYVNDKLHRLDGPAFEYLGFKSWYINGEQYTEKMFNKLVDFPELEIPYIVNNKNIYLIKFKDNIGIRFCNFAEVYIDGNFIKLSEYVSNLLLQFIKYLEHCNHVAPLLDWIQENSSYFPYEFIENLFKFND
jgi:hypothetical protein